MINSAVHSVTRSKSHSLLITLCMCAGFYGVVFGAWVLPVGLFVGPHVLAAAVGHLVLGGLYFAAARALRRETSCAPLMAVSCSFLCVYVGFIGAYQSVAAQEVEGLTFFVPFSLYFSCVGGLSLWQCAHSRFSLRHLLITVTMLSVAFGVIAYFLV